MSFEISKDELQDSVFLFCSESIVNRAWVAGSVISHADSEFSTQSDIDVYLEASTEAAVSELERAFSGRPTVEVVGDGERIVREIDVHLVLEPGGEPNEMRGRPIEQIY